MILPVMLFDIREIEKKIRYSDCSSKELAFLRKKCNL